MILSKAGHRVAKAVLQGKFLLVGVDQIAFVPGTCDMQNHLTKLLLLVSVIAFTINASADDRWETLRAINMVENPTNQTKVGRFGELGPYQFRPTTWRMHTNKPFSMAVQRQAADEVAVMHYEWIKRTLERAGVDASPFNIAMAWNSGMGNVLSGRAPEVSFDYADRVTNLVQTLKNRANHTQVATVPVKVLENPVVRFAVMVDMPRFEIVIPEAPAEPIVFTDREPARLVTPAPFFVVTTAATLVPRFILLPSLLD